MSDAVLALLWAVVICRIPAAWSSPWKRAPWAALAALAVGHTIGTPALTTATDRLLGIPDIAVLIRHLSVLAACTAVLDWVTTLAQAPGSRRYLGWRHAAAAAAAITLIALFAVMPRQEMSATQFTESATSPAVIAYLWVFYIWLGVAMTAAVVRFRRARRQAAPAERARAFGAGLLLLTAGCGVAAAYAACQMAALILRPAHPLGQVTADHWARAASGLENLATVLVLAGVVVPAAAAGWRSARELGALHALRPLWQDLITAAPEVSIGLHPAWHQPARFRNIHLRLIRRVAEIRDGALELGARISAPLIDAARASLADQGLSGPPLAAATEACWLRMAAGAASTGSEPPSPERHIMPGGASLSEETAWLRQVAAAYASPAVREVAAQLTSPPPPSSPHPPASPEEAAA